VREIEVERERREVGKLVEEGERGKKGEGGGRWTEEGRRREVDGRGKEGRGRKEARGRKGLGDDMQMHPCRSEGKQCAICMESVVAKIIKSERRFGILGKSISHELHPPKPIPYTHPAHVINHTPIHTAHDPLHPPMPIPSTHPAYVINHTYLHVTYT
jgi:hypothetical protein